MRSIPLDLTATERSTSIGPPAASPQESATALAIREAALTLFAERGYELTTMKAIALEVGIGASAIYNHVDSKQELLREIVRRTIRELISRAELAIASTDDVTLQLRRAVGAHVEFHAERRYEMFIGERAMVSLEEPARTAQIAFRDEYASIFQRLIERGITAGAFTTPSPHLAAYAILQMGMGVSTWYRSSGELAPPELGELYGGFALRIVTPGDDAER